MASIGSDKNGHKRILFVGSDKKRRTIRLGKVSKRFADSMKIRVEQLNAASITGHAVEDATARWLANLDDKMYEKLAKVGLVTVRASTRLQPFLENYIAKRGDVKKSTVTNWGHTKRNLITFFGADKLLREITEGDARDWELCLRIRGNERDKDKNGKKGNIGLAEDTVRKRCSNAKMFFDDALDHGLVSKNPFRKLKSAVKGNRKRDYFVSRDEAYKVLNACPDAEWRLIFALSRFGGLRCPSEHLRLRLQDVDWENERITIWSSKTEHYAGKESRVIPLFPELRPYLEDVIEAVDTGTVYFISRRRTTNSNLRTQLIKIIRRAGLTPWPKPFQNLRATRQTELEEIFPSHVVNAWIGNSRGVAERHYLQITDDHFARAARLTIGESEAAQNPAQSLQEHAGTDKKAKRGSLKKTQELHKETAACGDTQPLSMGDTGLEPVASAL